MKTIWTYFSFIRVQNCLIASLAVATGQYLSTPLNDLVLNHAAMAVAFFVCAFGNIVNDIVDIESDRINHPQRALPSGKITVGQAKALALFFLLISVGLAFFLNWSGLIIVDFALVLVTWYNLKLKNTAYWGNIAVSILGGLTFILGGIATDPAKILLFPGANIAAVFAFLMHFGREIIKDIEDERGDALAGSQTAPVKLNPIHTLFVAYSLFAILIALSISAYLFNWYNVTYFYICLFGVYIPLVLQFIWLGAAKDRKKTGRVSLMIKLEMIPGITALIIGKNY